MRSLSYLLLDVFSSAPFGGNQLAVFLDAQGLADAEMQAIAREMNLSECTFVMPPTDSFAHHRVRIFTPRVELPLAGHPTVGTAFALAHAGIIPPTLTTVQLQLGVGTLPVDIERVGGNVSFVWMHQPAPRFQLWAGDSDGLMREMGLTPDDLDPALPLEVGSAGVPYLIVPLRDLDALGRARSSMGLMRYAPGIDPHGVYLLTLDTPEAPAGLRRPTMRGRMFAPGIGIMEDPATGGISGALGVYVMRHTRDASGGSESFVLHQGVEMGRPSQIDIAITREMGEVKDVRIGGHAVVMGRGELWLPDAAAEAGA
ncbi:MAG TPA: PhzF family phenazine biosynthesis protein [Ktedonobacterales bacterium]